MEQQQQQQEQKQQRGGGDGEPIPRVSVPAASPFPERGESVATPSMLPLLQSASAYDPPAGAEGAGGEGEGKVEPGPMTVTTRSGATERVSFDAITARLEALCEGVRGPGPHGEAMLVPELDTSVVDPAYVTGRVAQFVVPGMRTSEIDELAAWESRSKAVEDPQWGDLWGRIEMSNLAKSAPYGSFSEFFAAAAARDPPAVEPALAAWVAAHAGELDAMVDPRRDMRFDGMGAATLLRSYLMRFDSQVVELPQWMYMRVAVGIEAKFALDLRARAEALTSRIASLEWVRGGVLDGDVPAVWAAFEEGLRGGSREELAGAASRAAGEARAELEAVEARLAAECGDAAVLGRVRALYDAYSMGRVTQASPTMFNSGTRRPQMASCYLSVVQEDSVEGIYDSIKENAVLGKYAGGKGMSLDRIRAKGSHIAGTMGESNGLSPLFTVEGASQLYIDQGGGKRKGALTLYLSPWHADVFDFVAAKRSDHNLRDNARALYYGMWCSDLFMERVRDNGDWSTFCPTDAPELVDTWGDAFRAAYERYEATPGLARSTFKARKLWVVIIKSQQETGMPFVHFKDACNAKSNQRNAGLIRCSNLCSEILQVTTDQDGRDEVAMCNLASVSVPAFVRPGGAGFDWEGYESAVALLVRTLDRIIDVTFYPIERALRSNKRLRPMGIGMQGLARAMAMLRIDYASQEGVEWHRRLSAHHYHAAVDASARLARQHGPYPAFHANGGCPAAHGKLQFDLWTERDAATADTPGLRAALAHHDWDALKARVREHGLRNSLLVTMMPTASTAQILGNTEGIEWYHGVVFKRKVLSTESAVFARELVAELKAAGLWNRAMRDAALAARGSIQVSPENPDRVNALLVRIPKDVRRRYRTVYEIKQRWIVEHAAAAGPFICQSTSMNIYSKGNGPGTLEAVGSAILGGWRRGLKTGIYYLRSRAVAAVALSTDRAADSPSGGGGGSGGGGATPPAVEPDEEDEAHDCCGA